MLTELIAASGVTGAVAGAAIVWLLRNWLVTRLSAAVKHEYDLKLEATKSDLRQETDAGLANLRNQLQREAGQELARLQKDLD